MRYALNLLNIEFMFGVLAAYITRKSTYQNHPAWLILIGFIVSLLMIIIITAEHSLYLHLVLAFGLMLLVIGFVLLERTFEIPWSASLVMLGSASYSIYLIHNPLLSLTQRFAWKVEMDWMFALFFGITTSLLIGIVYHLIIERPAITFFGKSIREKY